MAEFRSFVSEAELEERRQKRQEEWEKVRKPEDPVDAPEEEYDPRSLFERLQEQKDKKQAEFEETHRLRNMIRGLDDDEVEFLDLVDRTKEEIETQRWKEEFKEIKEFRKAVADLAEQSAEKRFNELKKEATAQLLSTAATKKSQSSLLARAVKRKSSPKVENEESVPPKVVRIDDSSEVHNDTGCGSSVQSKEVSGQPQTADSNCHGSNVKASEIDELEDGPCSPQKSCPSGQLKCVGVLPGLGVYDNSDSSDSENSSNSEAEYAEYDPKCRLRLDLLGRPRLQNYE